ncbi:MAG: hypothetical protein DLM57_05445 [Pseudonocardiales bacterium]|nr:MAG: hypothetical protein DLM57_05445 [Pseudonocardiales bacterium]
MMITARGEQCDPDRRDDHAGNRRDPPGNPAPTELDDVVVVGADQAVLGQELDVVTAHGAFFR